MSTINERFARLGELEADQIRKLYLDLTDRLTGMTMSLYEERGSSFLRGRQQEPERNAYSAMAEQVKAEAVRRGMLWLERCTPNNPREIFAIVPMDQVVARVKALETTVDKLMREVSCGR